MVRSGKSVEAITLTGDVLDWNEENFEEHVIAESQIGAFERDGYLVMEIGGDILATRAETPPDGTVTIQPKSDEKGRMAASGGHTNLGYSGYFRGYVFLGGRRKTLVDFWTLFEKEEHHYTTQYLKAEAVTVIRQKIAGLAGAQVHRTKGGYALQPLGMPAEK